jgi:hypothetical protein
MIRRRHDITPPQRVKPPTDPELLAILDDLVEDDEDEDETLDPEDLEPPPSPEDINERILDHR